MTGIDPAADPTRRFLACPHGNVADPPPPVTFVTFVTFGGTEGSRR